MPCSDIIYRGSGWIRWGRLECLVLTLSIVGGDGLDGETGMPCSDIIYRGREWIRWGKLECLVLTLSIVGGDELDGGVWHALF
jgi:hypothetical protein